MEELNKKIRETILEMQLEEGSLFYLSRCMEIINSRPICFKDPKYKKKILLSKSITYTSLFLDFLDPSYRDHFIECLENNRIFFDKMRKGEEELAFSDRVNGKNFIYLPYTNELRDTYAITHEVIHDYSLEPYISYARNIFCETFSLLAEKLQRDYIKEYLHEKEYYLNEQGILIGMKEKMMNMMLELNLFTQYWKNGYVTKMNVLDILGSFPRENLVSLCNHFYGIAHENKSFSFELDQRYVIGYLISCYMYERILEDPNKIEEFLELNDYINEYTEEDFLGYLELGLKDECYFDFTEDTYQQLKKSYIRYRKRIG